jgi:plasmid stability protein
MAKTTVELPEAIHRKLRVKAALDNSSMNDIVVAALNTYLHGLQIDAQVLQVDTLPKSSQRDTVSAKKG